MTRTIVKSSVCDINLTVVLKILVRELKRDEPYKTSSTVPAPERREDGRTYSTVFKI